MWTNLAEVLHPGLKTHYFEREKWEADWIAAAIEFTREEFDTHYAALPVTTSNTTASNNQNTVVVNATSNTNYGNFANVSVIPTAPIVRDEIGDYLRADLINTEDPLMWWYDNRALYPRLSRMAQDYLSIPRTYIMFLPSPPI